MKGGGTKPKESRQIQESKGNPRSNGPRDGGAAVATLDQAEMLERLLEGLRAVKGGDFSVRLPIISKDGLMKKIAGAFNEVVQLNDAMAKEVVRVGRVVGQEGKMTERASLATASGAWGTSIDSLNALIGDLVRPTTEVGRGITAVAHGDLSQKMVLEIEGKPVKGEFLRIGATVNTMVDQLSSFASEVTRVAKEVGTEGKLGGQAEVKGVIKLASFKAFSPIHQTFLDQLMDSIGVVLNMISASMRTEELLQELQKSNAELEAQAKELEEKASLLEIKNKEVELASVSLEEKAERLSLISKYKSEFLANMSHELRTPLNSLLILAKLLLENKDQNLTPKQVEYAHTIHASGVDLLTLINEILDLSKVESGKMGVAPREVPLSDVQSYVERGFREVAQQKGLDFAAAMDEGLPRTILTDERRLQQVLKNLLSNAFKFTEQGKVTLEVKRADAEVRFENTALKRADSVLAFSVIDTGIGIPKNKQKLIFEAFQQADGTTSRKYGGTGLGLTISREIASLLGGEIQVESSPGAGSRFTFYLPARYMGAAAELEGNRGEADEKTQPARPVEAGLAGKKILVIDDDVRNIFAVMSMLESHGVEALFAENGRDGIEALRKHPGVDLVLMDVMMPEMDGYETTRAIRRMPPYKSLPIIALTAKAMKGDREKCVEAGVSDYITKPVDNDRLLSMLRIWLDRQGEGKGIETGQEKK